MVFEPTDGEESGQGYGSSPDGSSGNKACIKPPAAKYIALIRFRLTCQAKTKSPDEHYVQLTESA